MCYVLLILTIIKRDGHGVTDITVSTQLRFYVVMEVRKRSDGYRNKVVAAIKLVATIKVFDTGRGKHG